MSTTVSEATSLEATASSEARPRRRKAVGINARHNGVAFLFLSPWLIGLMFLTLGPILASFYLSLTSYDMFTPPQWLGLDNYVKMFTEDGRYYQSLRVTFTYVFLSVPLKLAFALGFLLSSRVKTALPQAGNVPERYPLLYTDAHALSSP